jgi:hypothetical protein
MPGPESPIVLRQELMKLEKEYARRQFTFEMMWAAKVKRYGPKTLRKLLARARQRLDGLQHEEKKRWDEINAIHLNVTNQ